MITFSHIFDRQRALWLKFEEIEYTNRLLEWRGPIDDLDSPLQQTKLRRYLWNITEEIAEAIELKWLGGNSVEEVADAFHYLIELYLVCGKIPAMTSLDALFENESPVHPNFPVDNRWLEVMVDLGRLGNKLKNRAHKRKLTHTNPIIFETGLHQILHGFVRACLAEGITADQLANSYFDKADVNDDRIKSGV